MNRRALAVLFLLLLVALNSDSRHVASAASGFPVGLSIVYHMAVNDTGTIETTKTFRYEVLQWAENGGNVAVVNQTITVGTSTSSEVMYIDVATWDLCHENGTYTGSYIATPLWVNLSGWEEHLEVDIPAYGEHSKTYDVQKTEDLAGTPLMSVTAGTFDCWAVTWGSGYGGMSRDKILYYEKSFGVLVKEEQRTSYAVGPYQIVTHELVESNLAQFSAGLSLLTPGILSLGVIVIVIAAVFVVKKR